MMRLVRTECIETLESMTATPTTERVIVVRGPEQTVERVVADIRQRIADGEARPVLARHMTALGFDGVLLALARGES